MGWDTHRFGTWAAGDDTRGRLVAEFLFSPQVRTPTFIAHLGAGLPREDFDGECYMDVIHHLSIVWYGKTPDQLALAVNEALNAIVPGAAWSFMASGASVILTATVRDAEASEPYACDVSGRSGTRVDFAITCIPGWAALPVTLWPTGAATLPHVYMLTGISGSMPAPVYITHTHGQATTRQFIGARFSPAATFTPTQNYQGHDDLLALSGQCEQVTMNASGVAFASPIALDTNAHRGWYIAACRLKQDDAAPGDTTYYAVSTVTGSGISVSQTRETAHVPATVQNAYEMIMLGPLPIPAGPVPGVVTRVGYGLETVSLNHATGSTLLPIGESLFQLTTEPAGRHRGCTVKLKNTSVIPRQVTALLYTVVGGIPDTALAADNQTIAAGFDATQRFSWDVGIIAGSYAIVLHDEGSGAGVQVYGTLAGAAGGGSMQKIPPSAAYSNTWVAYSYAAETLEVDGTGWTCASAISVQFSGSNAEQTFKPVHTGLLSAVGFKAAAIGGSVQVSVYRSGAFIGASAPVSCSTGNIWKKAVLPVPILVTAGEILSFKVQLSSGASPTIYANTTTSQYPDGARTGGGDLAFKTYEQASVAIDLYSLTYIAAARGFTSVVSIYAANAGAGVASLDTVALIPYDEWSAIGALACAAYQGAMLDASGYDPDSIATYLTDYSGGVAAVDQSLVDIQGIPRLWPGDTALVVGTEVGNVVPAGGDLMVAYTPTYKTPYGG